MLQKVRFAIICTQKRNYSPNFAVKYPNVPERQFGIDAKVNWKFPQNYLFLKTELLHWKYIKYPKKVAKMNPLQTAIALI